MTNEHITVKPMIEPLLAWYRENARDLPWRHTSDPYKIWVSEIMLQQTRVAAVLGYYTRFMETFPNVYALAEASEENLMKLWEGLGYYSRARNMQKAAKIIVEQHNGSFPDCYDELLALPGIGEYTAGAISSAAYGLRIPAVDGNVMRVISRITEDYSDISDQKVKKAYRDLLMESLPDTTEEMKICNQAFMELGAIICVPNGSPKCDICPVADACKAYQNKTTAQLPVKNSRKQRRIEEKTVFVLFRDGKVALRKRSGEGLLAGLWEFPNAELLSDESAVYHYLEQKKLRVVDWKKQLNAKHIFTHIEWHMTGYILDVTGDGPEEYHWVEFDSFSRYAIPSAFSKFVEEVKMKQNT